MEWMLLPYRRYFDFSGRSCRKEYWMFHLLWLLALFSVAVVFALFDLQGSSPVSVGLIGLAALFVLGSVIPSFAVQVRRFHDQDKSGWMVLLNFLPYVGGLIVFVFMCMRGTGGSNRFGPDPLGDDVSEVFS